MADALFNADSVGQLASQYSAGIPGFDAARFVTEALAGFADRALMARMDWLADCAEAQLKRDFNAMAEQLEAAMPPKLDVARTDDDFGHFIHATPGILAVRHGLEAHPERALALIYEATQRFSMEFYIRDFINHWPEMTFEHLRVWAQDDNYHVRRLVSEGTRPKLPWAKSITMTTAERLPLLEALHTDPTRYVTRSVANHLNDLSKTEPCTVTGVLTTWGQQQKQTSKELAWMTRHALRTLIKQGDPQALELLGYKADAAVHVQAKMKTPVVAMGQAAIFEVTVTAEQDTPVLVDYRILFTRAGGKTAEKVFKLKQGSVRSGTPYSAVKSHKLKGGASTFTLYPGPHQITVQVNGKDHAVLDFELTSE